MIYENVELHNVAEVRPVASGGVRLQRVPERVPLVAQAVGADQLPSEQPHDVGQPSFTFGVTPPAGLRRAMAHDVADGVQLVDEHPHTDGP